MHKGSYGSGIICHEHFEPLLRKCPAAQLFVLRLMVANQGVRGNCVFVLALSSILG